MIVPVVLSGGSGSRLWPLSRELYPKQMLPLVDESTMLQNTVKRLEGLEDIAAPFVVCNEHHRFLVEEQLADIKHKASAIILEPVGRNTAPAVAVAALHAIQQADYDPILLVLPADHVINNEEALRSAIQLGKKYAVDGKLVTFGIKPTQPETGYGYIKAGRCIDTQVSESDLSAYRISCFVEKPNQSTAESYLQEGGYYWNSGMFMFKASSYINELEKHSPEMVSACRLALEKAESDLTFVRLDECSFSECPGDSIDYAVMEKTDNGIIIPVDAGWSDVGSWSALWEINAKDEAGNVKHGNVMTINCSNSYFHSQKRMIAGVGVKDLVVVETDDAVLVVSRNDVQDVKLVVNELKRQSRPEAEYHRKVYRPWGHYDCLDGGDGFQVKRITVKPGAVLSRQMHHHRAEHWIVVRGTAKITKGDEVLILAENQSTYIPLGTHHRLENPGKIPLELIEVQSGSYLGEDDIVRFDDIYGRAPKKG